MTQFSGFVPPDQNYFRLPNEWTNITCGITSLAELKVIEYVLRHTWGFSEYGKVKRITLDEFQYGRLKSDGNRMDQGTGLSDRSISDGIRRAVDDGYLVEVRDETDKGRIKRSYGLKISTSTGRSFPSDPDILPVRSGHSSGRTEKDTKRKKNNISEETLEPSSITQKLGPSKWDFHAADELHRVISSVVKVNKRMDRKKWANVFRVMRTHDQIPKIEIRNMIQWYSSHIGGTYDIEAYSAQSFRDKWDKLVAAKRRNGDGSHFVSEVEKKSSSHQSKMVLLRKVKGLLIDQGYIDDEFDAVSPAMLKDALAELGEPRDALTGLFVNSDGREE